ncbi:MAG: S-layer homology domain-containing protein [Clostridia bacterium]|nr:S-layer homology domain-containing protein [Clostridia bacterium]
MFKKKLVGIAVVLMIMLMIVSVSAEGSGDGDYIKEYEVLKSIGIAIDDFSEDREITRAETAKVVCEIGGYLPQSGETGFFDVPQSHSYAGYIDAACKAGFMSGYGAGVFEPDQAITYSELAKTILDMMGYGTYAGINGGYPEGYLRYASSLSFGKGTDGVSADAPLNGMNFAKILYNALDKKVLQLELNGRGTKYITEDGETFAYKYMKVKKGEGRVVATDSAAIIGQTLGNGTIKIDNETVIDKNGEGKLLLGYETEFWVREIDKDDMPELLYIIPDDDQKTIDLRSYDIIDVNTSRLTYDENSKEKHINLADDMVCIYNGDVIDYTPDDLKPYDGTVKIIINSDNRAAVAVVSNYTYGVVKGISSVGNKIVFDDGQTLSLDNYKEWKLIKNGNEIEFIELIQGNVLNVMASKDGTKLCAEVFGGKVSGRITGINNDAGRKVVYLDTVPDGIVVSPYYNKIEEIQLSYQGEWYTNILGDIFYSAAVKSGAMQYGYMASYSVLAEEEEAVMLKIFTSDGTFIKPHTKNKVTFVDPDGKNNVKLAYDKFGEYLKLNNIQPQLIKYMLDGEGYLQKVQFSELNYNKATGENIKTVGSYPVGAFTCDYVSEGGTTGYYQIGIFDCKYFLDPNAVIFRVPEDKKEEKEYSVISRADMTRKLYYAAELYDVDDSFESEACVINLEGKSSNFNWETTLLAIIDKSNFEYLESESGAALALNIYQGGKEGKIYCTDADMVTQETVQGRYNNVHAWDLKEGDVIAYLADSDGIIRKFELMYSPSREDGSYFAYSNEAGMPEKNDYSSDLYLAHGIIKGISDNGLVINANGDGSDSSWNHYLAYEASNTRTYLYDSKDKKWKSVAFSSLKKDDIVVVRMLGYSLRDVLIYE